MSDGQHTSITPFQQDYTGEWYTWEIRRHPADGLQAAYTNMCVIETGECIYGFGWDEEAAKMVILESDSREQYVHLDWVAVRKLPFQEPTVTVGEEHET